MEREDVLKGCASIIGKICNHYFNVSEYKKEYFDILPEINKAKFAFLKALKKRVDDKKAILTYNEIMNSIIEEREPSSIKASAFFDYEDVKEAGENYINTVKKKHMLLMYWMFSIVKVKDDSISIISKEIYSTLKYKTNLSPAELDKAWDYLTKISENNSTISEIIDFIKNTLHVSIETYDFRMHLGNLMKILKWDNLIKEITDYGDKLGYYNDFENEDYLDFIDNMLLPFVNGIIGKKIISVLYSKGYSFTKEEQIAILTLTCINELSYPYMIEELLETFSVSFHLE